MSNIVASWCQYECLRYVSFPVQVVAKAAKVLPVMAMGRCVQGRTYSLTQYATALAIALGLGLFLANTEWVPSTSNPEFLPSLSSPNSPRANVNWSDTTAAGALLLLGYLVSDAFTSNWQAHLFAADARLTSLRMMLGVNLSSALLTLMALAQRGTLTSNLVFLHSHPLAAWDALALSLTGATGQLFIFATIARFGAVTFTLMMTVRQALAVALSALVYGHRVEPMAVVGLVVCFAAVLARARMA